MARRRKLLKILSGRCSLADNIPFSYLLLPFGDTDPKHRFIKPHIPAEETHEFSRLAALVDLAFS